MAGIIEVKDQGKLRIYDADNSNYIDIVVPSTVSSNRTITLPDASFTVPTADTVGTGRIIQMVQATDGSSLSTSSTSYVDSGLTASITPGATSSKILILISMGTLGADAAGSGGAFIKFLRDSTTLIEHNTAGAHSMSGYIYTAGTSFSYLDSPSSTSSLTYKIQVKSYGGENFVFDNASTATITLLEVSQ